MGLHEALQLLCLTSIVKTYCSEWDVTRDIVIYCVAGKKRTKYSGVLLSRCGVSQWTSTETVLSDSYQHCSSSLLSISNGRWRRCSLAVWRQNTSVYVGKPRTFQQSTRQMNEAFRDFPCTDFPLRSKTRTQSLPSISQCWDVLKPHTPRDPVIIL